MSKPPALPFGVGRFLRAGDFRTVAWPNALRRPVAPPQSPAASRMSRFFGLSLNSMLAML